MNDTDGPTFADGLRALADLLDDNPHLKLPRINVCAASYADVDEYAAAFTAAGITITDHTDELGRHLTGQLPHLPLDVFKVHEQEMRRYYAERAFIADHRDEIDARTADRPVPVSA